MQSREDGEHLWLEDCKWYMRWSRTPAYLWIWPLDAWHNIEVFMLASAYVAGRGSVDASLLLFLAVALTAKTLFYEALLYKNPMEGLKIFWNLRVSKLFSGE
jgi:hypothetical protein